MSILTTIHSKLYNVLSTIFGYKQYINEKKVAMLSNNMMRVFNGDMSLIAQYCGTQEKEGKMEFVLLLPPEQYSFDVMFRMYEYSIGNPLYAYLTIPTPAAAGEPQQDLSEVLVRTVKNILHAHSQLPAGANFTLSSGGVNPNKALLEQLYVIYYDARNPIEFMPLDYAALQEVAQKQLTRASEQGLQVRQSAAAEDAYLTVVLEFLQHHQGNLQVVTQPQLRDFLIPSFMPLMELINHVYSPEDLLHQSNII